MSDEIEAYLDDLQQATRALPPREARHLVAEADAHLHDAVDASLAAGLSPGEAQQQALAAFGSVDDLVVRERARVRTPWRALAAQVLHSGVTLGAIGAVAVGLSGVVAGIAYLAGGATTVASTPTGAELTPANCARWLLLSGGHDCASAAMTDWAHEVVWYRIAFGMLGALVLLAHRVLFRRARGLAPMVSESVATTLFVCAAGVTLALGVDALIVRSGHGAWQWLSAMIVAAGAAGLFGWRLARRLREPSLAPA